MAYKITKQKKRLKMPVDLNAGKEIDQFFGTNKFGHSIVRAAGWWTDLCNKVNELCANAHKEGFISGHQKGLSDDSGKVLATELKKGEVVISKEANDDYFSCRETLRCAGRGAKIGDRSLKAAIDDLLKEIAMTKMPDLNDEEEKPTRSVIDHLNIKINCRLVALCKFFEKEQ